MRLTPDLRDRAFRWIADDVDPDSRLELQQVLASAMGGSPDAVAELADRMAGQLTFGTAGLRGPVRAGPNGMNRTVVVRTTAGVAAWLASKGHTGGLVIVGHDARHGSADFAEAAASVLSGAGYQVRTLPKPLPTPVLAFLVRAEHAVAGIQITASHNPPADNGYKLYDSDGTQIVAPDDKLIEAAIRDVPAAVSVPTAPGALPVTDAAIDRYLSRVATLPRTSARDLRVALTALHGVGAATAVEALRRAGFTDVHLVERQAEPDPDFPTVSFPNPEEPGATDLLLAKASEVDADLAIALDPDADRCALGVRDRDGVWRMLRGDETGPLLAEHILSRLDRSEHPDPLVATTIVSSSQLKSVAAKHGVRYEETLTGFKWLVRSGDGRGTGLVYAYEEALGHCVDPESVRDKDGISTAVLACDLAAAMKRDGRGLPAALDDLAVEHGLHLTDQISLRVTELPTISRLMAELRAGPPSELVGTPVSTEDLLPRTDGLRLSGSGLRVIVRPSGTEPKIKSYLEVVEPVTDAAALPEALARAEGRLAALRGEISALLGA